MTTQAKRYHFFDPPIDFLAPSRTRSAYVTEADYLALEQAAQEAVANLKHIGTFAVADADKVKDIQRLNVIAQITTHALAALEQAGVMP